MLVLEVSLFEAQNGSARWLPIYIQENEMGALAIAIQALQALVTLVPLGEQLKAQYDGIVASLQKMQAENRDPTPEEWQAVHDAKAALEAELNA